MSGGLMQLVAYGAQDVYLTGNPQITFFKIVYRRHTNFAIEPIQQTWNGSPDFGRTVTCNINRNGDLITNMYVAIILKPTPLSGNSVKWGYVNRLGHAVIDNVRIEIGGSKIDEQYGDWLNIWYELTKKTGQEKGYAKMIGDVDYLKDFTLDKPKSYQLYIPLQFWFNRNNGLALPLIALQYHDVRITLVFRKVLDCINWVGPVSAPPTNLPEMQDSYLLIDYIYLDTEERKRFAQASHEYLIEQLQFTGSETLSINPKFRLNFNHPSKYLVWAPHLERYVTRSEWLAYPADKDWSSAKDRFAKLLYIASRETVGESSTTGAWMVSSGGGSGTTTTGSSGVASAPGDLFEPSVNPLILSSSAMAKLLLKIEVKCVAQSNATPAPAPPSTAPASVSIAHPQIGWIPGTPVNPSHRLNEFLTNTIVLKNELTSEDLSHNIKNLLEMCSHLNPVPLELGKISTIDYHNYGNFVDGTDNPVFSGKLQLNGHDRFQSRDGNYFNYVQPWQHFSNAPCDGINVYSFALKPEDHQPTGTCNFSRIDNATLQLDLGLYNNGSGSASNNGYAQNYIGTGSLLNVYTINYNVLRVMSGMAGLAYSN